MELLKFIPIKLTLFLVCGILIGHYIDFNPLFPLVFVASSLLLLGIIFVKEKRTDSLGFGIFTGLITIGVGILIICSAQPKNHADHYLHKDFLGDHVWHVKVKEVLKSNAFSDRYEANIISLDHLKTSGELLLILDKDSTVKKLQVDNELIILSATDSVLPPLNPHQFNYKKYLQNLGIYHQMKLGPTHYTILKNPSRTTYGFAASIRDKIISKLQKANFGKEELSIIQALVLGQRNDISAATYDNYKKAGAVHILALSGLHIGILLVLLQFLLSPLERLPYGKTIKLVFIVTLLWGFALLAGFSASLVRAVTMFSFLAYALYLNRPANTFNILALSMFFILLVFSPKLLFQVGFQMSYAAVFAIVWMYPLFQKFWRPKSWLLQKGWQLLSVSVAAQLGVLPISLFYFHQFPALFFVSNLLIVPFLGVLLGMGILIIALTLLNILPTFLVSLYNFLIYRMNAVIGWVAQQEAFIFEGISFDLPKLLLSYMTIISLVLFCSRKSYKRILIFLMGIIGLQLWALYTVYETDKKDVLFVAHQTKNTVLLHQMGNRLNIFTSNAPLAKKITDDYGVGENVDNKEYRSIKNVYALAGKNILVVDSFGVYPSLDTRPDYVLLTQSPKIHLERFIDSVAPKRIIADGSNYKSYIDRWKATCAKKQLPFHYTGEKGAYYLK
ncbi:MAG: ComEC/Rec2 family competence protein [Saonia sp.]